VVGALPSAVGDIDDLSFAVPQVSQQTVWSTGVLAADLDGLGGGGNLDSGEPVPVVGTGMFQFLAVSVDSADVVAHHSEGVVGVDHVGTDEMLLVLLVDSSVVSVLQPAVEIALAHGEGNTPSLFTASGVAV